MKLSNSDMEIVLREFLLSGFKLSVTLKNGVLGCSDVQDACTEDGSVILFKNGDNYMINSVSTDENLLCIDDFSYISSIVDTFDKVKPTDN